jgi:hypothetical protein
VKACKEILPRKGKEGEKERKKKIYASSEATPHID